MLIQLNLETLYNQNTVEMMKDLFRQGMQIVLQKAVLGFLILL
jgi:hypothetical protein